MLNLWNVEVFNTWVLISIMTRRFARKLAESSLLKPHVGENDSTIN